MAFSIQRAVSDGTMTLLPVSIEYFDREEISVLFDGVLNARQWAWVGTTDKTLSFTPAVANTVEVMVVRSTDLSELRHQFSLGAQFTAESLDESLLQVLHIAQEATERNLGGDFYTYIDMHGSQITNLGAATAPDHAVTLAQYQADASGASTAKDTAVASASAAELAESNAKASEVAAAASAAAALHPWEAEAGGIHYALGNVLLLSPNGGLGYGSGAGGTVTQAASKDTSVTLNKPTGQITMNAAALAANTRVVFSVINNLVTANDNVVATYVDDFGVLYRVDVQTVWNGYFQIGLTNVTAGPLSQAVRINFAIIKGASA